MFTTYASDELIDSSSRSKEFTARIYTFSFRKLQRPILLITDFELISQVKDFQFVSFRSFRWLQQTLATIQKEKKNH